MINSLQHAEEEIRATDGTPVREPGRQPIAASCDATSPPAIVTEASATCSQSKASAA